MAWTAPRTWVTNEMVTSSMMNTHLRDQLLETAPAIASTAGRLIVVDGPNSIAERLVDGHSVATSNTTGSTSYTDLSSAGPTVTGTTGTRAFVWLGAQMSNDTAGQACFMSFEVTGASAVSPADGSAAIYESGAAGDLACLGSPPVEVSLTAGTNVFTAKYRVAGGTGTFLRRRLAVLCL